MKRIIPVIQLFNRKSVKTISGKNPNYIGCPINAVKIFSDSNASEIVVSDISASKNHNIDFDFLRLLSNESFVPLSYAGGVLNLEDYTKLFNIGFEKVIAEDLLFSNPDVVKEAVSRFGSSSIVGSCTIRKSLFKKIYFAPFNSKKTKLCLNNYLKIFSDLNVGEIFINNIIDDGCYSGFNHLNVVDFFSELNKPIIANGGISSINEIINLLSNPKIQGVGIGSLSCYRSSKKGILINYPKSIAPHLV